MKIIYSDCVFVTDPNFAATYLELIKNELNKNKKVPGSCSGSGESTLWRSKHGNQIDHEATLAFLALRKEYQDKFIDKKTCKNSVWSEIRDKMNSMGYFVGEGISGKEKVRQKFANLQAAYFRTKEKRKQTGEGKVQDSPYFEQMDAILGDQHKTEPVLLIDSLNVTVSSQLESLPFLEQKRSSLSPQPSCNKSCTSVSSNDLDDDGDVHLNDSKSLEANRFTSNKRTVRPLTPRNKILDDLLKIQQENQRSRNEEFKTMYTMFTEQAAQRHEETMALIKSLQGNSSRRSSKRKADSDDE